MPLEDIQKEMISLARSGSLKLIKLMKPRVEKNEPYNQEEENGDSDTPTILPILRSFHREGKSEKKEMENEGPAISSTGLIQYSDLLHLLTCPSCSQVVSPPVSQCRKGHLYCRACRTNNKIVSCRICKQTFLDAPNLALEKIITFIALPCKYGPRGCPSSVFLPTRLQHETVCQFRPVNCQFQHHGCQQVFSVKDMCWHHKMCPYAHHPHKNVLPNMPKKTKTSQLTTQVESQIVGQAVTIPPTNEKLGSKYER